MAKKDTGKQKMVPEQADSDIAKKGYLFIAANDIPLFMARHLVSWGQGRFDLPLARNLLGSYSLDFSEKWRVLTSELSSFQVDSLKDVFIEEEQKFIEITLEHPGEMLTLCARNVFIDFLLCRYVGLRLLPELEDALCQRIVKRAIRRGAGGALDGLSEQDWRQQGKIFSHLWRHAMPPDHIAWHISGETLSAFPEEI